MKNTILLSILVASGITVSGFSNTIVAKVYNTDNVNSGMTFSNADLNKQNIKGAEVLFSNFQNSAFGSTFNIKSFECTNNGIIFSYEPTGGAMPLVNEIKASNLNTLGGQNIYHNFCPANS